MIIKLSVLLIAIFYNGVSHILRPSFLPIAYKNYYYEQKFKIANLPSVEYRIFGLPENIFWTNNGTIFGKCLKSGQWKINVTYQSVTQTGIYQTIFKVEDQKVPAYQIQSNFKQNETFSILFPENLIYQSKKLYQIQLKHQGAIEPVIWKFITIPKQILIRQKGKIAFSFENQGVYVMHVEITDARKKSIQACIFINIQNSIQKMSQEISFKADPYKTTDNFIRLIEVKEKQTQVTKKLFQASSSLGNQYSLIKEHQKAYKRINNNLIQFQKQAKILAGNLQSSLRQKQLYAQKLKSSYKILQKAQQNLNLAMIQQASTNSLLKDSTIDVSKATTTYQKAAKQLQNQLSIIKKIQQTLLSTQQIKENSTQSLAQAKIKYQELSSQLLTKQKQLSLISKQLLKQQQQAHELELSLQLNTQVINMQETKYSVIFNNINQTKIKIENLEKQMKEMRQERDMQVAKMIDIDKKLSEMRNKTLFRLQNDIKDNEIALEANVFYAIKQLNEAQYKSSVLNEYIKKAVFSGCTNGQYPTVQGIYKIVQGSILDQYYQTDNGYKILFGGCTVMPRVKTGDEVFLKGYTQDGVIHAISMSPA